MKNNLSDTYARSAEQCFTTVVGIIERSKVPGTNDVNLTTDQAHGINAMANLANAYVNLANYYSQD